MRSCSVEEPRLSRKQKRNEKKLHDPCSIAARVASVLSCSSHTGKADLIRHGPVGVLSLRVHRPNAGVPVATDVRRLDGGLWLYELVGGHLVPSAADFAASRPRAQEVTVPRWQTLAILGEIGVYRAPALFPGQRCERKPKSLRDWGGNMS